MANDNKTRAVAPDDEILTIEEAGAYLKIGKRSIYKLVNEGKIPHGKILTKYRFIKSDLFAWLQNGGG